MTHSKMPAREIVCGTVFSLTPDGQRFTAGRDAERTRNGVTVATVASEPTGTRLHGGAPLMRLVSHVTSLPAREVWWHGYDARIRRPI